MSIAATPMSILEFNALPDNPSVERALIRGQLREKPMTRRNRWHAAATNMIGYLLTKWLETNPGFGRVFTGDVGCELPKIGSSFGIDVALFSSERLLQQDPQSKYIVGPPVLAVEVLSPSDTQDEILQKIQDYLDSDVKLVWIVEPWFQTVSVYRNDAGPEMYHAGEQLSGDPYLPCLQISVTEIFNDS